MSLEVVDALAQFGVAGLMGVLWVWERLLSRKRERQLSESHARLVEQRERLRVLVKLIHRNTAAIERFDRTQEQLLEALKELQFEMRRAA